MADKMKIRIKRVYEEPDKGDGKRILVDRLWPRGLTKAKATVDLWLKDLAPSTELRKWLAVSRRTQRERRAGLALKATGEERGSDVSLRRKR